MNFDAKKIKPFFDYENKIAMIKDRIAQLLEIKRVPKEKFFTDMGVTSANFRGKARQTPVNSDFIEKLFAVFPDLNLVWLISGNGEMFTKNEPNLADCVTIPRSEYNELLIEIGRLRGELESLKRGDAQQVARASAVGAELSVV